jgi:hypothetical protein
MARKKYLVAIQRKPKESADLATILECFRYAGLVNLSDTTIRMRPPHGIDSYQWAESNASRIASFGLRAMVAIDQMPFVEFTPIQEEA